MQETNAAQQALATLQGRKPARRPSNASEAAPTEAVPPSSQAQQTIEAQTKVIQELQAKVSQMSLRAAQTRERVKELDEQLRREREAGELARQERQTSQQRIREMDGVIRRLRDESERSHSLLTQAN